MISLETKQTVLARNLIVNQDVVDAAYKYMAGNIDTPYEFWYNSMSSETQSPFVGAELFAAAVYLRVEAMTGQKF
jgi:hypothetical protein